MTQSKITKLFKSVSKKDPENGDNFMFDKWLWIFRNGKWLDFYKEIHRCPHCGKLPDEK